ncbi:MAG: AAA family ATPase, partial [Tetragenococcus koreensis]|nr:AAA family ATPase [Tetragenococcus koreensis]
MEQGSLFSNRKSTTPLASSVRPKTIGDFVGQEQLLGQGKILREIIEQDQVSSMIFWGPPGVGKTTLAEIIARQTKTNFITVSAVNSGIKKIKDLMEEAETNRDYGEKTIIFVDEIHRFNKAQQDAFLPYVEQGSIILIGTTTENPSFEVNSALLSRCKVFVLKELTVSDIVRLLKNAIKNPDGFGNYQITIDDDAIEAIARFA